MSASIPRSGIREVFELANQLGNVIHLEIGQPDFDTSPDVIEAACEALRDGATRYTSNAGLQSLRETVASHVSARFGQIVSADRVVIAAGAVAALHIAAAVTLDPGDEVLVPDPCWPNYLGMFAMVGACVVKYAQRPEDGMLPRLETLQSLVTPKTRAILVNTPANPTGAVVPAKLLSEILSFAKAHNLFVISDEIYEDIVYDGQHASVLQYPYHDRCIYISGVSKGYAMTGFRLGYLVLPDHLVDGARAVVEATFGCVTTVSQYAALAAIRDGGHVIAPNLAIYERRRAIVHEKLAGRILGELGGAFYAMVEIGDYPEGSMQFAKDLLVAKRVAVAPGITFGSDWDRAIRISYAVEDTELIAGLVALVDFLNADQKGADR